MTAAELRRARLGAGWTQPRLASRLGVTQAYLSLMEGGKRRVTARVERTVASLFRLPPTCLPLPAPRALSSMATEEELEQGLARLGYPPLAYLKKPGNRRNPVALLLMGLSLDDLDPRLAEALPWLLLTFEKLKGDDLVSRAKSMDLQNRLGFIVSLARSVAERNPGFRNRRVDLHRLEQALEPSRLAREDTFSRGGRSERMKAWLRENRSTEAEHWNLLTDFKPEHLPYEEANPRAVAELPS